MFCPAKVYPPMSTHTGILQRTARTPGLNQIVGSMNTFFHRYSDNFHVPGVHILWWRQWRRIPMCILGGIHQMRCTHLLNLPLSVQDQVRTDSRVHNHKELNSMRKRDRTEELVQPGVLRSFILSSIATDVVHGSSPIDSMLRTIATA